MRIILIHLLFLSAYTLCFAQEYKIEEKTPLSNQDFSLMITKLSHLEKSINSCPLESELSDGYRSLEELLEKVELEIKNIKKERLDMLPEVPRAMNKAEEYIEILMEGELGIALLSAFAEHNKMVKIIHYGGDKNGGNSLKWEDQLVLAEYGEGDAPDLEKKLWKRYLTDKLRDWTISPYTHYNLSLIHI